MYRNNFNLLEGWYWQLIIQQLMTHDQALIMIFFFKESLLWWSFWSSMDWRRGGVFFFKCHAEAKQLEQRQDCPFIPFFFFTSKCNLNYIKDNLQSQLLCWNHRNSWQQLQRIPLNHAGTEINVKVHPLTTLIKGRTNLFCMPRTSVSPTKR